MSAFPKLFAASIVALVKACPGDQECTCPAPTAAEVAAELSRSPDFARAVASAMAAQQGRGPTIDIVPAPAGDPAAEAESCEAAILLAGKEDVVAAANRYTGCAGARKADARSAIDAAAQRAVAANGCAAKAAAMAAARIGAPSALAALKQKRCEGAD